MKTILINGCTIEATEYEVKKHPGGVSGKATLKVGDTVYQVVGVWDNTYDPVWDDSEETGKYPQIIETVSTNGGEEKTTGGENSREIADMVTIEEVMVELAG